MPRTWPDTSTDDFTVIALPDTQQYAQIAPNMGHFQTEWIAQQAGGLNVKMVLHEGDIVNNYDQPQQWTNAKAFMDRLPSDLPFLLAPGNHDYDDWATRDLTAFNAAFPSTRYTGSSWFNGALKDAGVTENVYMTVTVGETTFLFMALELAPAAATVAWAGGILTANTDKFAIVVTHDYLNVDDSYTVAGQDLWDDLIKHHDNIICVLSGHMDTTTDHQGYRVDNTLGGQPVHQIQSDYQKLNNTGDGYLRVMRFVPSTRKIYVETYSPYTNAWMTDAENEFDVTY